MEWIACKESVEGDKRIMLDQRRESEYLEGEKPKRGRVILEGRLL